jgi:hypothetical protein
MAGAIPLVGLGSGPVSDALTPKPQKSSLSPSDVHVLLVDDERLSRTVVSSLLRRCNYTGKVDFKPLTLNHPQSAFQSCFLNYY